MPHSLPRCSRWFFDSILSYLLAAFQPVLSLASVTSTSLIKGSSLLSSFPTPIQIQPCSSTLFSPSLLFASPPWRLQPLPPTKSLFTPKSPFTAKATTSPVPTTQSVSFPQPPFLAQVVFPDVVHRVEWTRVSSRFRDSPQLSVLQHPFGLRWCFPQLHPGWRYLLGKSDFCLPWKWEMSLMFFESHMCICMKEGGWM